MLFRENTNMGRSAWPFSSYCSWMLNVNLGGCDVSVFLTCKSQSKSVLTKFLQYDKPFRQKCIVTHSLSSLTAQITERWIMRCRWSSAALRLMLLLFCLHGARRRVNQDQWMNISSHSWCSGECEQHLYKVQVSSGECVCSYRPGDAVMYGEDARRGDWAGGVKSWDREEEDGNGVGGSCVGWVKGRWAHRQLRTTDLSKPTYRDSVIASLLGTVRRGRNRGYDTCLKITTGLLELKTRSVWVRMENEHKKHAGNRL